MSKKQSSSFLCPRGTDLDDDDDETMFSECRLSDKGDHVSNHSDFGEFSSSEDDDDDDSSSSSKRKRKLEEETAASAQPAARIRKSKADDGFIDRKIIAIVDKVQKNESTGVKGAIDKLVERARCLDANRTKILRANGAVAAIEAMKKFPADRPLQRSGCSLLAELAQEHDQAWPILLLGGFELVTKLMETFNDDEDLLSTGCHVLNHLAKNTHATKDNLSVAVVALFQAMESNQDSSKLQESACSVLDNLCRCTAVLRQGSRFVRLRILSIASNVARKHRSSDAVQKFVDFVVRDIAENIPPYDADETASNAY